MAKTAKSKTKPADENFDAGDFESLLSMTADTVPEPKLVPTGTWTLKGKKIIAKEGDGSTDLIARFTVLFNAVTPHEDVDEDEAAGGEWKGEAIFHDIRIEKKSDMGQLVKLLGVAGIDTEEGNVADWIKEFNANKPSVIATVSKRTWTDKNTGDLRSANSLKGFTAVK